MAALLLVPVGAPLALGAWAALSRDRRVATWSGVVLSVLLGAVGVALLARREVVGLGLLRADQLSAYLLTVIGAVGLTSTWGGVSAGPRVATAAERRYAALVCVFLGAMSLADYDLAHIQGQLLDLAENGELHLLAAGANADLDHHVRTVAEAGRINVHPFAAQPELFRPL